jgi:hypothetical protein
VSGVSGSQACLGVKCVRESGVSVSQVCLGVRCDCESGVSGSQVCLGVRCVCELSVSVSQVRLLFICRTLTVVLPVLSLSPLSPKSITDRQSPVKLPPEPILCRKLASARCQRKNTKRTFGPPKKKVLQVCL